MAVDADIKNGWRGMKFHFILDPKLAYAPVLAPWMLVPDSVSFYVRTSILFALNVSQRADMGSAKEIKERGKKESRGQRGGEKVREDNTYENAGGKVFRTAASPV